MTFTLGEFEYESVSCFHRPTHHTQSYNRMCYLKRRYPDKYFWLVPMPGEFHFMVPTTSVLAAGQGAIDFTS